MEKQVKGEKDEYQENLYEEEMIQRKKERKEKKRAEKIINFKENANDFESSTVTEVNDFKKNEIEEEAARLQRKKERKERKRIKKVMNDEDKVVEVANEAKDGDANEEESTRKEKKQRLDETTLQDDFGDLNTFETAKAVFPKVSWKMFDTVTAAFSAPTPIQAKTWGATLAGRDVIGIATTGSGKTLAFVLPLVAKLMLQTLQTTKKKTSTASPLALVLAPTRELCTQSFEVAQNACRFANISTAVAYGGQSRSHQLKALAGGADFLVATPGRLMDFMDSGDVSFDQCQFVVLDEADRMLDMGFEKDVRKILASATLKTRQTLMFSATWPEEIRSIAAEFLQKSAVRIALSGEKLQANSRVEQQVEVMDPKEKDARLFELLANNKSSRTIVFALYKKEAERVQQNLHRRGYKVVGIHGDKNQTEREAAVASFAKGDCLILVATDVASRGLDIKGVELVINYTFPLTVEDYVHRIGRTGRAGASGRSITFFTEHDKARAGELQNVLRQAGAAIPTDLLKFGNTVKKKEHAMYGAHYKRDADIADKVATMVTFDSDDE